MTSNLKRLVLIGVATFVVAMIIALPARVAYQWFVPAGAQLAGIDGSIWSGSAREVNANGIYLRDVEWQVRPLSLLTGKLGLRVSASPPGGFLETDLAMMLGGDVILTDLRASVPLQMFAELLSMPGLSGEASVDFARLRLDDGLPVEVAGMFTVGRLTAPKVDPGPLGSYRAEFMDNESGVIAAVEDIAGVFDLAGTLTIKADGEYEFLGLVAATEQTSDKLRGQLRYLGSPNDRGQREIRLGGVL